MISLLFGALGFFLCFVYDLLSVKRRPGGKLCFFAGCLLIFVFTLISFVPGLAVSFAARPVLSFLGIFLSVISLASLVYILFFAVPQAETYDSARVTHAISDGVYGKCRHPGFWPFALMYVFLLLTVANIKMTVTAIVYIILDLAYVFVQDKYIFPITLTGYDQYKKIVPFLIPHIKRK